MGHRGRPRSATARRRATTRAGRAPPSDRGTVQLRKYKLVLAGSVMQEADCLGVLHGRGVIDEAGFRAGRSYGYLTMLAPGLGSAGGQRQRSVAPADRRNLGR
ncbi:MAG TPA: hypothetical protein VGF39_04845 [Stellaceae bacterium]